MRMTKEQLYRQNHDELNETPAMQRARMQAEIDKHKEEFFAKGGAVKMCGPGESGVAKYTPSLRTDGLKRL